MQIKKQFTLEEVFAA